MQALPRKTPRKAAKICVSKVRLIAWRGVTSVIVQDQANAVPTESPLLNNKHSYLFDSILRSQQFRLIMLH
jgi:hypothetical protein